MSKAPMRKRVFGLDRAAVDHALQTQTEEHAAQLDLLTRGLAAEHELHQHLRGRLAAVAERLHQQLTRAESLEHLQRAAAANAMLMGEALERQRKVLTEAANLRRQALHARSAELSEQVQRKIGQFEQSAAQTPELATKVIPGPGATPAPSRAPFSLVNGTAKPAPTVGWRPGTLGVEALAPAPATPRAVEPPPPPPPPPTDPLTTGIQSRLSLSLPRMLAGKVVGRDLHDGSGTLLAARGTPITPELITRIEAAGLLPDLIMHMAWPEGGSEP